MSLRHIRRKQQALEMPSDSDTNGSSSDADSVGRSNGFSFALLSVDEPSDDCDANVSDADANGVEDTPVTTAPPHEMKKLSKKKKKKQKKKGRKTQGEVHVLDDDDYDLLQELKSGCEANLPASRQSGLGILLQIDRKKLDADAELKRFFGKKVVDAARKASDAKGKSSSRNHAGVRNQPRRPIRITKSCFVTPREDWPPPPLSQDWLYMEVCGHAKNGDEKFRFKRSQKYLAVHGEFNLCVETMDPNAIGALLQRHPYHVESLLQMSEIYRQIGEVEKAQDMVERALFVMELGFHPRFAPKAATNADEGMRLLPYEEEENVALYLTLLRYMQGIARRGCATAALEVAKFLLSLDPSGDPVGVLLCFDYYALRSGEYGFFLSFCDEYNSKPLYAMPNFVYSCALARFRYAALEDLGEKEVWPSQEKTFSLFRRSAEGLLKDAVTTVPEAVLPLIRKATDDKAQRDPMWKTVFDNQDLKKLEASVSPLLQRMVNIFVERSACLWKDAVVLDWLRENLTKLIESGAIMDTSAVQCRQRLCRFYPKDGSTSKQGPLGGYQAVRPEDYSDNITTMDARDVGLGGPGPNEPNAALRMLRPDLIHRPEAMPDLPSDVGVMQMLLESLAPWNTRRNAFGHARARGQGEETTREATRGTDDNGDTETWYDYLRNLVEQDENANSNNSDGNDNPNQ
eukprot:Rmarinus@m.22409